MAALAYFAHSYLAFLSANFPGTIIREHDQRIEGLLDNGTPYFNGALQEKPVELTQSRSNGRDHRSRLAGVCAHPRARSDRCVDYGVCRARCDRRAWCRSTAPCSAMPTSRWRKTASSCRWIHAEGGLMVQPGQQALRASVGRSCDSVDARLFVPAIGGTAHRAGAPVVVPDFIAINLNPVDLQHLPERTRASSRRALFAGDTATQLRRLRSHCFGFRSNRCRLVGGGKCEERFGHLRRVRIPRRGQPGCGRQRLHWHWLHGSRPGHRRGQRAGQSGPHALARKLSPVPSARPASTAHRVSSSTALCGHARPDWSNLRFARKAAGGTRARSCGSVTWRMTNAAVPSPLIESV